MAIEKKKNITIKDIAKLSGYSTQTVSRVVNNDAKVKKETKEKILEIIKKYNYKSNYYAKSLVSKSSKNILILLKRRSGHKATIWTNILVNEVILKNKRDDISIMVEHYYNDEELKKSLINKSSSFVDGVILFYEEKNDKRIEILKRNEIPFVVFGKSYDEETIYVSNDDFNSSFKAIENFFKDGIENIAFITGSSSPMNEERLRGVQEAYRKNNKDISKLIIEREVNTSDEIKRTARKYIDNLPECFFVNGDEKAIVLMRELFNFGIQVPRDVLIMGFDKLPVSEYTIPSLSTVSLNYKKLAEKLLEKLINMMEGIEEKKEEIESELVLRESTDIKKFKNQGGK